MRRWPQQCLVSIALLSLLLAGGATASGAQAISLVVDGETIACDVPPQMLGGRVLVPIRIVSQALGCSVGWDPALRKVTVTTSSGAGAGGSGFRVIDASGLYAKVAPSVVAVLSYVTWDGEETLDGWGSGFVFSADGDILTNAHVVEGATRLRVVFPDGRAYDVATEILTDTPSDVALIRLGVSGFTPLKLADSDKAVPGEPVIAIGNPARMQLRNTITAGIVSGIGRQLEEEMYPSIQTDASINAGNSGGPLLNAAGEVIGITYAKMAGQSFEGLAFAIPANVVKEIVTELEDHGRVVRPWLGLSLQSSPEASYGLPTDEGLIVVSVDPKGPSFGAGVKVEDEIIAADGRPTHSLCDLCELLLGHSVGDTLILTVLRSGARQDIPVKLAERPPGIG
jgi:serine protease Do